MSLLRQDTGRSWMSFSSSLTRWTLWFVLRSDVRRHGAGATATGAEG